MEAVGFAAQLRDIAQLAATPVPEDDKEIFKFKYQARAKLVALQTELLSLQHLGKLAEVQLAQVLLTLGTNYIEAEELGAGQEHLESALRRLRAIRGAAPVAADGTPTGDAEDVAVDTQWDFLLMEVYNHLGVLWSGRGENPKALRFLEAAERLYDARPTGGPETDGSALETCHLQTVFFLAQVHAHLGDKAASSRYCMTTLQKQLLLKKDFDKAEWMTNALHLSGFFLDREDFSLADYCIRAADHVISAEEGGKDERVEANLNIAYGKYHSHALRVSYRRLEVGDDTDLVTKPQEGIFALPIPPPVAHLPLIRTFDQARDVFKKALPRLETALQFYTFDTECTTHVDVQSDISVLWRNLINYESDLERRVSMHKRRAALYEPLVGGMQVQCYMSYLRKMTYELGEVWNEIGDIRQLQLQKGVKVGPKKINEACHACVKYYELFLATFLPDQQTNQSCELPECDTSKVPGPEQLDEDYQRTYVMANMHIARQYTRIQCTDFTEATQRIMAARDRYLYTVDCAKRFEITDRPDLQQELRMCEEMAALLPTKLRELRRQYPE